MKIKLFKKNNKSKTINLRKVAEIDPFFYWKRILVFMLLLLIIVAGVSFVLYYMVNRGAFITTESREQVKSLVVVELKESDLNQIFNKFEDRSLKRQEIIKSTVLVPDPSKPVPVLPVKTETKPATTNR